MISANIIADSLSSQGHRLTTYILVFPRIILSEFNTHRVKSRNSASSRAIPFKKMVEMVKTNPFIPIKWMKDHSGMQGTEYITDEVHQAILKTYWLNARDEAVRNAEQLNQHELTKQLCNRLLEPFMWHTVIVTASEWQNFFALRANPDAEIHMEALATQMLEAYNASSPVSLKDGEWHIPFGDQIDRSILIDTFPNQPLQELAIKIATARCARISYNNFDGSSNYEADVKLHDRLASSGHWSPFEHCAKAMTKTEYQNWRRHFMEYYKTGEYSGVLGFQEGWCGNFRGWVQYRKMFPGENKCDNRINFNV